MTTNSAYTQRLNNIRLQVRLLRVYNGRILVLFFLWGHAAAHRAITLDVIFTCLALLTTYGLLSISNYLYDQKIDLANKKTNPFNQISSSQVSLIYYSSAVLLMLFIFSSQNNQVVLFFALSILGIGHVYSHPFFRFSDRPLTKFLSMSAMYTFLPALLGIYPLYSAENVRTLVLFCLLTSSWFFYSDIRDIEGDLLHNKRTVANTLGTKKTTLLAAGVGTISYLLLLTTSSEITLIYYLMAVLPACQWLAFFNQQMVTNRKSLITMNILWMTMLLTWIGENLF